MMEPLSGTIKFTRIGAEAIIEIRDDASREIFLRIEMADFDLMTAIRSEVPHCCLIDLQKLQCVGLQVQTRVEHVRRPKLMRGRHTITDAQWRGAMRQFESDGWKGTLADCRNPQRAVFDDAQAVTFRRYVKPENLKPCPKP